jgi:hypothetical protein
MIHCDAEYDLEIEEIMILFKRWTNTHTIVLNNMNEAQIVDLIIYYFPDTEIEDGKYIHKIMSRDWNKKDEIRDSLDQMRSELIDSKNDSANISFYELYEYYCKKQRSTNALIVSKQYFEKYILENLSEYVMNDAFIIGEWIFT